MKRLIAIIALWLISTVALGLEVVIERSKCTFCANPYIGGDIQWHKGGFKLGDNFSNQAVRTNIYGGLKLSDTVSAEIGTDRTHKSTSYYRNYHQYKGIYATAVFNQPLANTPRCDVLGGIGYAFKKGLYKDVKSGLTTDRTKAIPRLMGGVQYKITPELNWRAAVIWENTKELSATHSTLGPIKPENTFVYSLGLNYTF